MNLFKNQKGFSDVITVAILAGIIGSIFIGGVFVWQTMDKVDLVEIPTVVKQENDSKFIDKNNTTCESTTWEDIWSMVRGYEAMQYAGYIADSETLTYKDGRISRRIVLRDITTKEKRVLVEEIVEDNEDFTYVPVEWSSDGKYLYFSKNKGGIGPCFACPKIWSLRRINIETNKIEFFPVNFTLHDISYDANYVVGFDNSDDMHGTTKLTIQYLDTEEIIQPELNLDKEYSYGTAYDSSTVGQNKVKFTLYYYTTHPSEPDYQDTFIYNIETGIVSKY